MATLLVNRFASVRRELVVLVAALLLMSVANAQIRTRQMDYINQYTNMAVDQMKRYKIPASITLAQGLLESGAGTSRLARVGNNHFGIKCGGSWKGPYMLVNDDAPNEHFRVYSSAEQSYEDHSLFLCKNARYSRLFTLKITDYKGWAHGLKAAGYATNPNYAYNLIQLIENYNLSQIDQRALAGGSYKSYKKSGGKFSDFNHQLYSCNKTFYVFAKEGDTFKSLSKEFGVSARHLREYNEVGKDYELQKGEVVFIGKKQKKADKSLKGVWHQVKPGESMHSISQHYAIRMKTLYKTNFKSPDYIPQVGDLLLVR